MLMGKVEKDRYSGGPVQVNEASRHRSVMKWYLISLIVWAFDFKPSANDALPIGVALVVQLPILILYSGLFIAIFMRARAIKISLIPLSIFILVSGFFCVESVAMGFWNGQDAWRIISNLIPIFLFISAAISTYVALCNS